jgi:hypothetical protein
MFPVINRNKKMCQTGNKNLFPHTNKIEIANLCVGKKDGHNKMLGKTG